MTECYAIAMVVAANTLMIGGLIALNLMTGDMIGFAAAMAAAIMVWAAGNAAYEGSEWAHGMASYGAWLCGFVSFLLGVF